MKKILALVTTALLSACATDSTRTTVASRDDDVALAKALAGKVAGQPQHCLPMLRSRDSQTFRSAIVYRDSRRLAWRNDMGGNCSMLQWDRIPVFRVFGSQICRGDIVSFVDRSTGMQLGACAVGDFVPYRTP